MALLTFTGVARAEHPVSVACTTYESLRDVLTKRYNEHPVGHGLGQDAFDRKNILFELFVSLEGKKSWTMIAVFTDHACMFAFGEGWAVANSGGGDGITMYGPVSLSINVEGGWEFFVMSNRGRIVWASGDKWEPGAHIAIPERTNTAI